MQRYSSPLGPQHSDAIGKLAPEQRCGEPEASILRLHMFCGTCPVGLCKQIECGNDDFMVILGSKAVFCYGI